MRRGGEYPHQCLDHRPNTALTADTLFSESTRAGSCAREIYNSGPVGRLTSHLWTLPSSSRAQPTLACITLELLLGGSPPTIRTAHIHICPELVIWLPRAVDGLLSALQLVDCVDREIGAAAPANFVRHNPDDPSTIDTKQAHSSWSGFSLFSS
jgi:hypothetical protein